VLFCAWLAWSRFRVVVPLRDKTMPSVVMGLDRAVRMFGGCPTYALTDNEKTVSVDHVCGIAVRNPQIVEVGRHYGLTIATCVPANPQSKGGSEATVRVAKADLVPTDHNLRPGYGSFGELETACEQFMADVNTRPHRSTLEAPVIRLAEEHARLHRLPRLPHTLCFGETRKVNWQSLISDHRRAGQLPARASDRRQRGPTTQLTHHKSLNLLVGRFVATSGEKRWPPVGKFVAAVGENSWPLTRGDDVGY